MIITFLLIQGITVGLKLLNILSFNWWIIFLPSYTLALFILVSLAFTLYTMHVEQTINRGVNGETKENN